MDKLISTRPYFARALYDWIEDNKLTPYVLVDADADGAEVPRKYVREGRIILNVSSTAVRGLDISNDHIRFSARFGGVAMNIEFPIHALLAIYAKENGKGVFFERDGDLQPPPTDPLPPSKSNKPSLKVVK